MGRHSDTRQLVVWLNGIAVGEWLTSPGQTTFSYFEEWIGSPQARPLSLSMPFRSDNAPYRGAVVTNFFDNLLPDSDQIRRRLAQRFHTEGVQPFQLLEAVGRDCAGAIQLLPPNETPANLFTITGQPVNERDIAHLLRNITSPAPLGSEHAEAGDLRLSIAGAQEKSALLWYQGQWLRPTGSTPTTHILKLPMGLVGNQRADMRTSVENEWLCARIARGFGLSVADCAITQFEDQKVLVVSRFDRKLSDDKRWIVRLPQEDFCQATGTSPLAKYQSDGGPGVAEIMDILSGSEQAKFDRRHFFKTQILFWLLAATDGHAKNFSLFHLPGSRFRATPLYDLLSAHPIIGKGTNQLAPQRVKLAMAIQGSKNYYQIHQIQRSHWGKMAEQVTLGKQIAQTLIEEILATVDKVINDVIQQLPPEFPQDLADVIFDGLLAQCSKLKTKTP